MQFRKYLVRSWLAWSLVFTGVTYLTFQNLEAFDWSLFWFIYTLGALFVMNPLKRRHLHFTFHEMFVFITFFLYGLAPALLLGQLLPISLRRNTWTVISGQIFWMNAHNVIRISVIGKSPARKKWGRWCFASWQKPVT